MSRRTQKSIFGTPAIVKLIYEYLDPSDSVSLARSSRQLFQTVMPLLWERVEGVSRLFKLLPALSDARESKTACRASVTTLTETDFSRFNDYALWIKHLEVCEDRKSPSIGSPLGTLCRYSATRTLLPNVTTITSTNTNGVADVSWVLPFLSPSLLRLEFISVSEINNPTLAMTQSSVLLHALSEKCPKLQTLAILPESKKTKQISDQHALEYVSSDNKAKVGDRLRHGLAPFIYSLPPLVSFTCSDKILDHACFKTISNWPRLESLTINLDPYGGKYTLPDLPDAAFPSLKHLALYWLPNRKTFSKFWDLPVLVSKLTSVKLFPSGDLCREKEEFTRILLPILSTLAERSPHLQDLWFWAIDSDEMRALYSISISTLDVLKKLPLRTLYLEGVDLTEPVVSKADTGDKDKTEEGKGEDNSVTKGGDEGQDTGHDENDDGDGGGEGDDDGEDEGDDEEDDDEDEDEGDEGNNESGGRCTDAAERLATMFPGLKELGLPNHGLSFVDLQTFHSKLPQLEALRFDFSLTSLSDLRVDLGSVARNRHSPFHTLEANFFGLDEWTQICDISSWKYDEALLFAQYLFSLWPDAQIAAQLDPAGLEESPTQEKMIELINEYLLSLSYCNRDPSTKYEDIKILNEESWKACSK
ncbi:hypothetical protein FRC06_005216 [Ceratobasidium sp. 370]|nr:hypothetical protein FRC06_005216 [Ceratobasidium sp. 370]